MTAQITKEQSPAGVIFPADQGGRERPGGRARLGQPAGVTCLTASDCVAVGQVGPTGSTNVTGLSGFWNGKTWRLVAAN